MSSNASATSAGAVLGRARLGDVGGQQRLVAGAVEVDGVGRDARVADREREAVQARRQLARDRLGDARDGRPPRPPAAAPRPASCRRRGPPAGRPASPGALERAARSAARQHAPAPVVVGRRVVVRAHDDDRAAAGEVEPELAAAGDDVAAVGDLAAHDRGHERGLGGLRRAVGRAQALDLGGDQRRDDAQERGRRLARAPAQPQPADDRVADPQLVHARRRGRWPSAPARRRSSARRRRARSSSGRSARARRRARAPRRGRPPAARDRTRPHRRWPRGSRGRPPRQPHPGPAGSRAEV